MTRRELTPADYIAMLRRHWVLILIFTIVGPPLGYGLTKILPAKYTSQTLVLVQPPTVSAKIVEQVDTVDLGQRLASLQQQILSRTRLEPIIRQLNLFPTDINRISMDQLVARLQKDVDVSPVQAMAETDSGLPGFFVNVTMSKPQTAQAVCTAVTSMFIEESLKLQNQRSAQTTDFLSQQLTNAKAALDAQDAKLADFKIRYLGTLPDDEQTNLSLLNGFNTQLDSVTQALARAQQDKSFSESLLEQQRAAWQESEAGNNPLSLEQQLAALQQNLISLRARYTDDYPDVIKAESNIAALQKQIAISDKAAQAVSASKPKKVVAEPASITQLRAQVLNDDQMIAADTQAQEKLRKQIDLYESRVQSSPVVEEKYKELTRGYQTALDSYNDLLKKRDASVMAQQLNAQQDGEQFYLLDPANLPDTPSFPKPIQFTLGGLAGGLGLGLALVFALEMKDTSMRTERDVEFVLHLPVLAMIPTVVPDSGKVRLAAVGKSPSVDSGLGVGARA